MQAGKDKTVKPGYAVYGYHWQAFEYKVCRWYLYPLFWLGIKLYYAKLWLYHTLNDLGIMHTTEGCYMRSSDIWKDWKWLSAVRMYVGQKRGRKMA